MKHKRLKELVFLETSNYRFGKKYLGKDAWGVCLLHKKKIHFNLYLFLTAILCHEMKHAKLNDPRKLTEAQEEKIVLKYEEKRLKQLTKKDIELIGKAVLRKLYPGLEEPDGTARPTQGGDH